MPTAWDIGRTILWLAVLVGLLSMLFKYLLPSCLPFLPNHYEHFASDPNTIDQSIIVAMRTMIQTLQTLQTDLENKVDNIGDMKVQTCSVYDQYHNNYIQSKGSEAPNESEYSLPAEQQTQLQRNRMHYAEQQWGAKVQFFQTFKHQTMLDCSKVNVSGTPTANFKEGFNNPNPNPNPELDTLSYQLGELIAQIKSIFTSKSGAGWASDCEQIAGTANFTHQQIQIALQGLQHPPNTAEGFSSGSFPIPYPDEDLTADQRTYYNLLSDAQDLVNMYQNAFGTTYQATRTAYDTMNSTYQTYLGYINQLNSLHSVAQAIPPAKPT